MNAYVTLEGYVVRRTTELVIGISRMDEPFAPLAWLPRSACDQGEHLVEGDDDIVVRESIAEEKGLDF